MSFIKILKSDRLLLKSILAVALLAFCHWIQWHRSGHMIQPLIRAICASLYVIIAIFTGRKLWSWTLFVWAISLVYFNRFCNYTSFIMILIAVSFKPSLKNPFIIIYSITVAICLYLYKDSWTHFVIHFLGCYFFFLVYQYTMAKLQKEKKLLILEAQERQILQALANGKQQKEIEFFNKNTVTKKLNNAKSRNDCTTTGELLAIFKEQSQS